MQAPLLQGLSASLGITSGKVRVVKSKDDYKQIEDNEILVIKSTEPQFAAFLMKVKAIITEEGGLLSHAAIVARELAIPCIMQVTNATSVLKNGQQILVDADKGQIYDISK